MLYRTVFLKVIDETLSPTWDELLVFEEVLVYGRREDIKANPPTVIIEIYDQDKVSTFGNFESNIRTVYMIADPN